jgi:hypothetical protein
MFADRMIACSGAASARRVSSASEIAPWAREQWRGFYLEQFSLSIVYCTNPALSKFSQANYSLPH